MKEKIEQYLSSEDIEMKNLGLALLMAEERDPFELSQMMKKTIRRPFSYRFLPDIIEGKLTIVISDDSDTTANFWTKDPNKLLKLVTKHDNISLR